MYANAYQNVSKVEKVPPRKHWIAILIYLMLIAYLYATDQPLLPSLILLTAIAVAYLSYIGFTIYRS